MREIKNITELQSIILEIQEKIHAFCVKHEITYSLSGGTCIGAVRHKGFIPWDDDIDLFLTRKNYEKFLKAFEKESIPGLRVATYRNRKRYFHSFAKVEDERTELHEIANSPSEIGVNIDLFPLSGLPNLRWLRLAYLKGAAALRAIMALKQVKPVKKRSWLKNCILTLGRIALCWLPLKVLIVLSDKYSQLYNYDKSEFVCELFSGVTKPFSRKAMDSVVLVPFEDKQFCVMEGYHDYMTATYGNYMQLPPLEKRVTHHAFTAFWKEC